MKIQEKKFIELLGITPGPWKASPIHGAYNHGISSFGEMFFKSTMTCNKQSHDIDHANAQLVATSLEMLCALVKTVAKAIKISAGVIPEERIIGLYAEEIAIIEKATGQKWAKVLQLWNVAHEGAGND